MKKSQRFTAVFLTSILTVSSVPLPLLAQAADTKEEVIYIMADASGDVKDIYAVNIFGSGEHTDYGSYRNLKILNTQDTLTENSGGYSFSSDADKIYVQGTLVNTEIPWDISITYFLDGKEISASELGGKSGKLEIKFCVQKNDKCETDFYDGCAIQADFTLDTKICRDISAPDATIANVGSNKQLTYTILPGKGIDTSITADVTDFEMPSASINGVRLNLNVSVDTSRFSDKINELTSGIGMLDTGAKLLSDSTGTLKSGTATLKDGSQKLADGADTLDNGISTLEGGVKTLQEGLDTLYSKNNDLNGGSAQVKSALDTIQAALNSVSADTESLKTLISASGQIESAVQSLQEGANTLWQGTSYTVFDATMIGSGLDISSLQSGNNTAIQTLNEQIAKLTEKQKSLPSGSAEIQEIQEQINSSQKIIKLLSESNSLIAGTKSYFGTLNSGAKQLNDGLSLLSSSYVEFHSGLQTLVNTLSGMIVKLSSLSDGITQLAEQYTGLDDGIQQYTDGVAKIVAGYQSLTNGTSALVSGSKELKTGASDLNDGVSELYDGTEDLSDGSKLLADGTGKLRTQTDGIDEKIDTEIDSLIGAIKGSDITDVSFTSEKNTSVSSVQFVIKTDAVVKPAKETPKPAKKKKLSLWQKFLNLFK